MYPEPNSRSSSISLLLLHIFSSLINSNSVLSVAYVKVIHNCSLSQCTSYQQILRLCLQNTSRTYVSQQLYCIHLAPSQYFSHRDSYHFSLGSSSALALLLFISHLAAVINGSKPSSGFQSHSG